MFGVRSTGRVLPRYLNDRRQVNICVESALQKLMYCTSTSTPYKKNTGEVACKDSSYIRLFRYLKTNSSSRYEYV